MSAAEQAQELAANTVAHADKYGYQPDSFEVCVDCGFPLGEEVCACFDRQGYRHVIQVPQSLHAALTALASRATRLEARAVRAEAALREWRELGTVSSGGYGGTLLERTDAILALAGQEGQPEVQS